MGDTILVIFYQFNRNHEAIPALMYHVNYLCLDRLIKNWRINLSCMAYSRGNNKQLAI